MFSEAAEVMLSVEIVTGKKMKRTDVVGTRVANAFVVERTTLTETTCDDEKNESGGEQYGTYHNAYGSAGRSGLTSIIIRLGHSMLRLSISRKHVTCKTRSCRFQIKGLRVNV